MPRLSFCGGIAADVKGRLQFYIDDFRVGLQWPGARKALASTIFIFFTNIMPAITFAYFLADRTHNALGVVEVVLAMGIGGSIFAMFAGQPLVIVGVTGPVSIFCATLYDLAVRFGINFCGWLFWTSFWAALMHIGLASFNACRMFPKYVTRFSEDVFGFLISCIYVYEGCREFVRVFQVASDAINTADASTSSSSLASPALLSLLLGLGNFFLASQLSSARTWTIGSKGLRSVLADYGPSAAIIVTTAIQFVPVFTNVELPRLQAPSVFGPSTPGRSWLDAGAISDTPTWAVFAAILPAAVLTSLLFFDHNISSLLSQRPEYGLKKPGSFDWDFCLLGISVLTTGLLGLPPNYGLIPQAPLHVRSLAKIKEVQNGSLKSEVWVHVLETRVSALGQSLLTFALLSSPLLRGLSWIPKGVLAGLFLFLGFAGFRGNAIAMRVHYLLMDRGLRAGVHEPWATLGRGPVAKFTLLQLIIVAIIFGVTLTDAGIVFPVLIVLMIPLRLYVLPRIFSADHLRLLDPRDRIDAGGPAATDLKPTGSPQPDEPLGNLRLNSPPPAAAALESLSLLVPIPTCPNVTNP